MVLTKPKGSFYMEYVLKVYYRVKYALVCARQSFLKNPPKDDFEEYAKKVVDRAYFIILNKIDELDGTNERLLKYYKENIEKFKELWYNKYKKGGGDMKKVNVIPLIAILCLLLSNIINLLSLCIKIPLALSVLSLLLALAAGILFLIFSKKQIKDKKQDKSNKK